MDKPRVTPKDFFLWAGAMLALYASVFAFISLIFDYLDYAYPSALQYFAADPYSGGLSYEMASLIVLVPLCAWLLWAIRRSIQKDPTRADVWVRRWALYLTLFVAGATVVIDLITLVMYFLQGDVTLRFILKVLVVLMVAGAGFLHFLADLRGYWVANPGKSRSVAWGFGVLVVVAIVSGFFIVGTPWQARLYRFDEQKVSDLQSLQSQIVYYWQSKEALPASLAELNDSISGYAVPTDPQSGASYNYATTSPRTFKLCADFNAETQSYASSARTAPAAPASVGGGKSISDNWYHGEGETCFSRTIDPQLYPPFSKTKTQ